MKTRVIATAALIYGLAATAAHAVPVFTQTIITGDASILNPIGGTLIVANDLGIKPSAVTVNGVTFGTSQANLSANLVSTTNPAADFSTDAFSVGLDALLSDLVFASTTLDATLTLGGLTSGERYLLQLLFSNDVNFAGNDFNIGVSAGGPAYNLANWQDNAINLQVAFVATSANLIVTFNGDAPFPLDRAVLNAYALHRTIPEPNTIALLALGLLGAAGFAGKRRTH